MIRKNKHFIKDFVFLMGVNKNIYSPDNYIRIQFNKNIILFFKENKVYSDTEICLFDDHFEIIRGNSFFPVYYYKKDKVEVLTSDYSHIFNLQLSLSISQDAIAEFVLYNTTLNENTFHNEVQRLYNIEKIELINNQLQFHKKNQKNNEKPLLEYFLLKTDKIASHVKMDSHGVLLSGGSESRINAAIAQFYELKKEFITWGHPEDKEYLIANKIAKRLNIPLRNIRPDISRLPYTEILQKTGYLANMQYAYRYAAIKELFEKYHYDHIWTGWGDINGYPVLYQPSELFTNYYLGLFTGEKCYPSGWNEEWLKEYTLKNDQIEKEIDRDNSPKTFFNFERNIFALRIFGQVLSVENTLGSVIAPWFDPDIYPAIEYEESKNVKIISHKIWRTIWKNELYFQLIRYYCPELNYIKNAKGYYPWLVRKRMFVPGLVTAAFLKKISSRKKYPFDPVEDKIFIKTQLEKIAENGQEYYDPKAIYNIIKNIANWKGPDILEYFKMIQIYWFINSYTG